MTAGTPIQFVVVASDERIEIGQQALWLNKKLMWRGAIGDSFVNNLNFDTVSINPLDFQRFKELGTKYDA